MNQFDDAVSYVNLPPAAAAAAAVASSNCCHTRDEPRNINYELFFRTHQYSINFVVVVIAMLANTLPVITAHNTCFSFKLYTSINIALCVELCLTRYGLSSFIIFCAAYYVRIKLKVEYINRPTWSAGHTGCIRLSVSQTTRMSFHVVHQQGLNLGLAPKLKFGTHYVLEAPWSGIDFGYKRSKGQNRTARKCLECLCHVPRLIYAHYCCGVIVWLHEYI